MHRVFRLYIAFSVLLVFASFSYQSPLQHRSAEEIKSTIHRIIQDRTTSYPSRATLDESELGSELGPTERHCHFHAGVE